MNLSAISAPWTLATTSRLGGTTALSLRRNVSWTLAGNTVYGLCQWAMLVLLVRLTDPAQVGRFSLAFAVSAPIMLFASLKLRSVVATDTRQQFAFTEYAALRLFMLPAAIGAVLGVAWIAGYGRESVTAIVLIALAKAVDQVSDILHGRFQQHERLDLVAKSLILRSVLSIASMALALVITGNVEWACASLVGSSLLILVAYDIRSTAGLVPVESPRTIRDGIIRITVHVRHETRRLGSLFRMTLPLGLLLILGSLAANVPRYFVERFGGTEEQGIFSAIAYVLVAGSLVVNALGQSATPRLARLHADGARSQFRRLVLKMVLAGATLGLAGVVGTLVAGRRFMTLLYGETYAAHERVLLLLSISAALGYLYIFLGTGLSAMRRFTVQLPIHLTTLLCLVALCAWLVPERGATGAALAMVISSGLECALYVIIIWRTVAATESDPTNAATQG